MKISVITAAYNSAKTIKDTIVSVLSQTYDDIEYIIVDGGSTDETIDIVKSFEPQFKGRMRWVSEKDNGIYDAMNKGIALSTGDVIGIINSDDFYTSNDVIERMVNVMAETGVDAVFGDIHFVDNSNLEKCVRYYNSSLFKPYKLRFGLMPAHPSFYVKRSIYETCGLYSLDYKIASDYEMMVRMFYKERISYKYIPMDFVTMRLGGISTANLKSKIQLMKEDVKACTSNGMYTNYLFIASKFLVKIFELRLF